MLLIICSYNKLLQNLHEIIFFVRDESVEKTEEKEEEDKERDTEEESGESIDLT